MRVRVIGTPAPQGSKRAIRNSATGRLVVVESGSARVRPWREDVRAAVADRWTSPTRETVEIEIDYVFSRPASHYGARGLKPSAPFWHRSRPDLDKLVRATLDALTGVVFVDDAQVVKLMVGKRYANEQGDGSREPPGCWLSIVEVA